MSESKDLTRDEILALERGERTVKESLTVDLKPCPFCGGYQTETLVSPTNSKKKYVRCSNGECPYGAWSRKEDRDFGWNSRPIEDALRSRIEELEKAIYGLTLFISGLDECDIYDQNNLQRELDDYFAMNRPTPPKEVLND